MKIDARGTIPYILVMGLVVANRGIAAGATVDIVLGVLSIPCAWIIWRHGGAPGR